MIRRLSPALSQLLKWALGLGLIAVIFFRLDREALTATFGDVSWAVAAPAIAGLVIVHLLPTATWKLLLDRIAGIRISWLPATSAYYASQALGSFTPANIGGDVYRYYLLKGASDRWASVAIPILVQRLLSYAALLILAGVAVLLLPLSPGLRLAVIVGVITLTGLGLLLWMRVRSQIHHIFRFIPGPLKNASLSGASIYAGSIRNTLKDGLLLSLLFHLAAIALSYLLALSLGADGSVLATLAVLTLARLAMLLPFSPSGLGFQEGSLALLFPHIGLPAEMGLAVSLLNRLALVVTIGIGFMALGINHIGGKANNVRADHMQTTSSILSSSNGGNSNV